MARTFDGKSDRGPSRPVEGVTFHNEENGFCVLRVSPRSA
jgi:hypothetical protein